MGRLAALTDGAGSSIASYAYDLAGRLTLKTNGNGTYSTYAYCDCGELTSLVNYAPGGAINSRFDYAYNSLA